MKVGKVAFPAMTYVVNNHYFEGVLQTSDYWRRRCEAAEDYIAKSPCDPDITVDQIRAHEIWQAIRKEYVKNSGSDTEEDSGV